MSNARGQTFNDETEIDESVEVTVTANLARDAETGERGLDIEINDGPVHVATSTSNKKRSFFNGTGKGLCMVLLGGFAFGAAVGCGAVIGYAMASKKIETIEMKMQFQLNQVESTKAKKTKTPAQTCPCTPCCSQQPSNPPTPLSSNPPTPQPIPIVTSPQTPTAPPSKSPTDPPTSAPTSSPTANPTHQPSNPPTTAPSQSPTASPTSAPTNPPTSSPNANPTQNPDDSCLKPGDNVTLDNVEFEPVSLVTDETGGGQSHENMQPYLGLRYIIALQGVFPSRTRVLEDEESTEVPVESQAHRRLGADPFLGEIIMFGGNFAPVGWADCNGQLIQISQNQALYSLLGTTYGGDGQDTFALPDLRGRVPLHPGNGPGLSNRIWGQKGGSETVTLTTVNMPSHTHDVSMSNVDRINGTIV